MCLSIKPIDVLRQIKEIYRDNFEKHPMHIIEKVFGDVIELFNGKMKGFHKCDTKYHDIQHTQETALVMAQIMDGWNRSGNSPNISPKFFQLGIIAALFHDVGYIKKRGDNNGTGAKYTFQHVKRSVEFVKQYLPSVGYTKDNVLSIQNMILCTCSRIKLSNIHFLSKQEKITAFSLGTADLLAQMSAKNYLKKLPFLFSEFKEAYEHEGLEKLKQKKYIVFKTAKKLINNTPNFYKVWVRSRFKTMGSIYKSITFHFNDGRNIYIESIENNMKKITKENHGKRK